MRRGSWLDCPALVFSAEKSFIQARRKLVPSPTLLQSPWFEPPGHRQTTRRSAQHPRSDPVAQVVAPTLVLRSPTLQEFDETFNRVAGGAIPPFPFPSARAYYTWASSHEAVHRVQIPFLALCAADDPIVRVLPINTGAPATGNLVFAVTRKGGHLGWFEERADGSIGRWFTQPVLEWMRAVGQDIVVHERPGWTVRQVNGFLVEVGNEGIGCKEIAGGGRVVGIEGEGGLLRGL